MAVTVSTVLGGVCRVYLDGVYMGTATDTTFDRVARDIVAPIKEAALPRRAIDLEDTCWAAPKKTSC